MIISRTPVRISFFGGGTDYREFYERAAGAVLGVTINKYVYVSVNRLSEFFDYQIRVGYSKAELVNRVDEIQHPSVRECLKFRGVDGHLDIHIFADLPARTGLGSSSAFTVGFLNALSALDGKIVSKAQLAREAHRVEQEMIRENVGSQDQVHAAFGGLNVIEFSRDGFQVRPVVIHREKWEALQAATLLFYTGINRFASEVVREQVANTRACTMDDYLQRMRAMVGEAEQIISAAPCDSIVPQLGELLHEGWELKKRLSSQVTNPTIDALYARAREAGASGGKLCGAGNGGFFMLLVAPERQAAVRAALSDLLEVRCQFEREGSSIIYLRT